MISNKENVKYHLEIQQHRKKPYGLIRSSYRENGQVKHDTMCRLNGLDLPTLKLIQASIQGNTVLKDDFKVLSSKEYGASFSFLQLAKNIGFDKLIYSRPSEQWVKDSLAMIIGRIIYSGSKLSLTRTNNDSTLWAQCGVIEEKIDVNRHCYNAMDELLKRQGSIQKKLASKHLADNSIILYDITSSYLEGEYEDSDLVHFGYNRDKKKGHEQIVIGLICASNGCPIAVEVFAGNTKDEATVQDKIREIKNAYGVREAVFVGDRGMITKKQLEGINENEGQYIKTISALTHAKLRSLCESEHVQMTMFDEKNITEVELPDTPGVRYGLCKNPLRAIKEKSTRQSLIEKTASQLDKIIEGKRKTDDGKLGIRVGKIINKYKMGKFIITEIKDGKLDYRINENKVSEEEQLDGLYVIFTDVPKGEMDIKKVVESYRKLVHVEQSFRNLKSPLLEIRPLHHKTDKRIKCHIFLCMLSYYLLWNMNQCLNPLYEKNLKGKNYEYTVEHVLERLKSIRKETVEFSGVKTEVITECDKEQAMLLELLGINIK